MKAIQAIVISDKMKDAVVVQVERIMAHPIYHKRIRSYKKMHVHDELGAKTGDVVKIQSTRPISKTIFWKVIEIVKKNGTA